MRSNLATITITFVLIAISAVSALAQTVPLPSTEEILDRAGKQSAAYTEAFKNLLAIETKTFDIFKKDGEPKKHRTVVSNFLVYPLSKTANQVVEFRNVLSVDGKSVGDADKRAQNLFEKVAGSESSENEITKLREESTRHDLEIAISGMTLFEGLALNTNLRPSFEFSVKPVEKVNGRSVYIVTYRQTKDSPYITVNSNQKRSAGEPGIDYEIDVDKAVSLNARLRGTLAIDAETFQLWSEIRELTIQLAGNVTPITVIEDRFEFQTSDFGILTPKLISHTQYRATIKENRAIKEAHISFEYGNFSRPGVEVKSSEVKH